ncbi:PH domain-containing protein [Streptomyces spirodelae]|uniref:PH domain-containing protein n=1 Tax=Streptomyces spirodelae TaxID=2812904 RepID=A0ABS3WLS6_9ACTN|nr:PH domain-containing protein [Streptomyces spirodelae]MBO8184070.1 PH domain-containing protein [Streptomyces spirodelae]
MAVLPKVVLRHRARCALWSLASTGIAVTAGVSGWAELTMDRPGPWKLAGDLAVWVVLLTVCWRFTGRRVVLGPEGVVLVGVVRVRRVEWPQVAEVELAHRMTGAGPQGRWRIALLLHDGTRRWAPGFLTGSMYRGEPEFGPGDRSRYGRVHTDSANPPDDAPAEMVRLHRELRGYWLSTGFGNGPVEGAATAGDGP